VDKDEEENDNTEDESNESNEEINDDVENESPGILLHNEPELALDMDETTGVTEEYAIMDDVTVITKIIIDYYNTTGVDASENNTASEVNGDRDRRSAHGGANRGASR
jgi:hypothetical protein